MPSKIARRCLIAFLVVVLIASGLPSVQAQQTIQGRYIVVFNSTIANPGVTAASIANARNFKVDHVYTTALKGFSAQMPTTVAASLAGDSRVAFVDVDQPVRIAAQVLPTGIDRMGGDRNATAAIGTGTNAVNVDIAVLDTGSGPHPDLNIVGGTDCTRTGIAASYNDDNGHGSHVAGIAAARDNGMGGVGVAPGARIWSVKVLNSAGNGSWSQIICGIDWVTQRASTIEVANMSLAGAGTAGTSCTSSSLRRSICNSVNAGVTYAVAAGNIFQNVSNFVPAAFPEVITVSALADYNGQPGGGAPSTCRPGTDDAFADFSNYGAGVDIAAPGVCIYSTWLNNGYNTISGTSMASPHVAGAAALYIAVNGRVGPTAVRNALVAAREQLPMAGDPDGIAEGIVNVSSGNQAPAVAVSQPANGATVAGSVPLRFTASDEFDTASALQVKYHIDGGSPTAATFNTSTQTWEATWNTTGLPDATHTIVAKATDRDGSTTSSSPVSVITDNVVAPPTANAGPDQALADADGSGTQDVALDGSGSSDTDGSIVSYAWQEDGTTLATTATATVSLPVGSHTLTLTVTDNGGATGSDTVVVVVAANEAPTANAGANQTVTDTDGGGAEDVALDGTGSSDVDGSVTAYAWQEGGTTLATGATATVSLTVGTHTLTLTVTDDGGATDSDTVVVTVAAPDNQPPSADAGPDQELADADGSGDEDVDLDGTASSDADGSIVDTSGRKAARRSPPRQRRPSRCRSVAIRSA